MDLVPVTEIAQELGVDRTTIWRWIRSHDLQTYEKLGDRRTYADRKLLRSLVTLHPKHARKDPKAANGHS